MIGKIMKNLVDSLSSIPTISKKNAENIAFFLFEHRELAEGMSDSLLTALQKIRNCVQCHNLSEGELCRICLKRSKSRQLCVVHGIQDLVQIEKAGGFDWKYHILGGKLDPLQKIDPDSLNINELASRIKREGIDELVLALDNDAEGELTAHYLANTLRNHVNISKLATGIPTGGKVGSYDKATVAKAILNKESI